ncbi:MAG: efflux RND transporter periplasmic adaptor subunit [Parachlamydiaceae bacterium]|nr:MAG: efflux RND transporter periplasmic adaptor subunit [Parachlamydiaceae bacterium]
MIRRPALILIVVLLLILFLIGMILFFRNRNDETNLILYGNVDVRQVDISFRVSGRVILMPFQEGDIVTPGVLMGVLDKQPYADQVKQARAAISSIQTNLDNAEKIYSRRQELVSSGSVSEEDFENTRASRNALAANLNEAKASLGVAMTNLSDTEVFAPNVGTILTRIREPGSVVKAGDPIYTLSLTSPVWIRAFVTERQLGEIFPGMLAEVRTDTPGGKVYEGHIGFISPVAEFTPKTVETTQLRTDLVYRLRIIADNPDEYLKQGMPVTVKLIRRKSDFQEGQ